MFKFLKCIVFLLPINVFAGDILDNPTIKPPTYDGKTSSRDYFDRVNEFVDTIQGPVDLTDFVLFSGRDIAVRANFYTDSPHSKDVWICFNYAFTTEELIFKENSEIYFEPFSPVPFASSYFKKRKINHINICPTNKHWYQTWEMEPVISLINKINAKFQYNRVVTYGNSMGGIGAINFTKRFNANCCLATCPRAIQYDDINLDSWRQPYNQNIGMTNIYGDIVSNPNKNFDENCTYILFYGLQEEIDSKVAESAKTRLSAAGCNTGNFHCFGMNASEHVFIPADILKSIVDACVRNDFVSVQKIYSDHKDDDFDLTTTCNDGAWDVLDNNIANAPPTTQGNQTIEQLQKT